jgi:hypothetical protein
MVVGRVVKRPRGGHRFFKIQHFGLVVKTWLKIEIGRGHYGEGETAGWEGQGVDMWHAGTSKLVPPSGSIKDRSVGPHEQVLNVPITSW